MARQGNGNGDGMIWFRRIVPIGYKIALLRLTGLTPLLMHSTADVRSKEYRAYKLLSQKKGKTLSEEEKVAQLDWKLGLYLDEKIGPFIPGVNIGQLLRQSASNLNRKGASVARSLRVPLFRIPLIYEGPRDEAGLWKQGFQQYDWVRNSGAGSGRVVRCRPMFSDWQLEAEIAYDDQEFDFDYLEAAIQHSEKFGLGDWRPGSPHGGDFGIFEATLTLIGENGKGVNGSAIKPVDEAAKKAHDAHIAKILQYV